MEEAEQLEKKQPSILKTSVNYGLFTGIGLILLSVIFYLIGELGNTWLTYISYLVLIGGIIAGIKYFRDEENAGVLSYGRALGTGTLIGLFAAIISSIFTILLFHVIDPAAMQQLLVDAELRIIERMPNITDAELESALRMTEVMMRPAMMFIFGVISFTFVSFILSLIISAFMRKNPSVED